MDLAIVRDRTAPAGREAHRQAPRGAGACGEVAVHDPDLGRDLREVDGLVSLAEHLDLIEAGVITRWVAVGEIDVARYRDAEVPVRRGIDHRIGGEAQIRAGAAIGELDKGRSEERR